MHNGPRQSLGETPRVTPLAILFIFGKFVLLFLGSLLLGLLFGLATAFTLRKLHTDSAPQVRACVQGTGKTGMLLVRTAATPGRPGRLPHDTRAEKLRLQHVGLRARMTKNPTRALPYNARRRWP